MTTNTINHLIKNVLPAAQEYEAAENELTAGYAADPSPAAWEPAAEKARRKAADVAVAIDGLTDRCATELGLLKSDIRSAIAALCTYDNGNLRDGAHNRVRGVANAYKHFVLSDATLPIASEADILVTGLGYGLDGFGVGKFSGIEVLVKEKGGDTRKFLGDVPISIAAWFRYLGSNGGVLPTGPITVCGMKVHP